MTTDSLGLAEATLLAAQADVKRLTDDMIALRQALADALTDPDHCSRKYSETLLHVYRSLGDREFVDAVPSPTYCITCPECGYVALGSPK